MDSATEELYYQKLQEFIQDDDKIVTVSYLAKALNITLQDSIKLIGQYVEDQRKLKPNDLAVTYVLTGILKKNGYKAVFMLKELDLQKKKDSFKEICSEVVFSMQKSKNVDFNVIALVDKFDSTNIGEKALLGSVVGKNCTKRVLKFKKLPSPPPSTLKGKSSFFMSKSEDTKSVNKQLESVKTESKSKSVFNKTSPAKPSQKNTETNSTKGNKSGNAKGGLSMFLTKSTSKPLSNSQNQTAKSESSPTEFESEETCKSEDLSNFMEVVLDEFNEEANEEMATSSNHVTKEKPPIVNEKTQTAGGKEKQTRKNEANDRRKSSKRQRDKSSEANTKRRKRIIERDDSESDDLFENDPPEEVIEKSDDEPERVVSTDTKKPLAPKNKKRKAVERTYKDEEGYIVTKTEYVYETASEDENEIPPPKQKEEKPKPKALDKKNSASSENDVSPQKGGKGKKGKKNNMQNQPTLMNFFKKK